jgi:hypothetical protein
MGADIILFGRIGCLLLCAGNGESKGKNGQNG